MTLGVPVNWSAYEDIAEFFTRRVIDGKKVYGHMDYGKKDPSLGWRFTDAWLSMAGAGDEGDAKRPASRRMGYPRQGKVAVRLDRAVSHVAAPANGPAAVYAVTKAIEWLEKYSPPAAAGMTFSEAGPIPAQGNVAQQMFWYTAFTAASIEPDLPVMNEDGTPKWRMAPSPHGAYWSEGTENRLSRCRFLDTDGIYTCRSCTGRVALCAVRDIQNCGRKEKPCWSDIHS